MPDRALGHFTREKNPVGCAAALATIDAIQEEGLVERSRTLGAHVLGRLNAMRDRHPLIADVRGLGLLIGVELVRPKDGLPATAEAEAVMYHALENGLSFKVTRGNILTLIPPLTIADDELDRAPTSSTPHWVVCSDARGR